MVCKTLKEEAQRIKKQPCRVAEIDEPAWAAVNNRQCIIGITTEKVIIFKVLVYKL
jgi:methionine synthase II (cobalamin-independent)